MPAWLGLLVSLTLLALVAWAIFLAWQGRGIEHEERQMEQRSEPRTLYFRRAPRPSDDEPPRAA